MQQFGFGDGGNRAGGARITAETVPSRRGSLSTANQGEGMLAHAHGASAGRCSSPARRALGGRLQINIVHADAGAITARAITESKKNRREAFASQRSSWVDAKVWPSNL